MARHVNFFFPLREFLDRKHRPLGYDQQRVVGQRPTGPEHFSRRKLWLSIMIQMYTT